MKNRYIIFLLLNISIILGAQSNRIGGIFDTEIIRTPTYFYVNLPYFLNRNVRKVFVPDTPYAIDIINISADGTKLFFTNDPGYTEPSLYYETQNVIRNQNKYFITMYWYKYSNDKLVWSDSRGIIHSKVKRNEAVVTNSIQIEKGMKELRLEYRILLPFPFMTIARLQNNNIPERYYSDNFIVIIDLTNVFEEEI
ncbi:hypothetical protein LQZ19_02920 [Treponema primitia]|uniref:hypothetical protein n=1 Tax=Treponema primitia TaxID=88058 RepID=UPI003980F6E4